MSELENQFIKFPFYKTPNQIVNRSPIIIYPPTYYFDEIYVMMDDRAVKGIMPNRYLISNYGNVWDLFDQKYVAQTLSNNYKKYDGNPAGYYSFHVQYYRDPFTIDRTTVRTNRMVLVMFNWVPDWENLEANHENGNHADNRLCNLSWTTRKENLEHSKRTGLIPHGEYRVNSSISNKLAREIAEEISTGKSLKEIANKYSVSYDLVSGIKDRHSYRYVSKDLDFPNKRILKTISTPQAIKICELLMKGKYISEISDITGISTSTIYDIKRGKRFSDISSKYNFPELNRISGNTVSSDIIIKVCEKLQNGEPADKIANELGISKRTVISVYSGHGYKYISKNYTFPKMMGNMMPDETVASICEHLSTGKYTNAEIAKIHNVNESVVSELKSHNTYKHISDNYIFPEYLERDIPPETVHYICQQLSENKSPAKIAKETNVLVGKIYHIKYRDTHKDISKDYKW